jgi:hypothetical protein
VRDLEDERRIAYVGIARARVRLGLRYAAERYGDNVRPSRALALQFAHPYLGHESKYAPIITRQRKEPVHEGHPRMAPRSSSLRRCLRPVHGASGGVGIAAVQLARARGLTVIGTAGTERGHKLVLSAGAPQSR